MVSVRTCRAATDASAIWAMRQARPTGSALVRWPWELGRLPHSTALTLLSHPALQTWMNVPATAFYETCGARTALAATAAPAPRVSASIQKQACEGTGSWACCWGIYTHRHTHASCGVYTQAHTLRHIHCMLWVHTGTHSDAYTTCCVCTHSCSKTGICPHPHTFKLIHTQGHMYIYT